MENNLKNRYIYAVTRHLPIKIQEEVRLELEGLISEMLEARSQNGHPAHQDLKDVLNELGSPRELALKYYGGERKALIGGTYYLMYMRVLKTVLPIVAVVLVIVASITIAVNDDPFLDLTIVFVSVTFMSNILQGIVVTAIGVVQAFAAITIVFAVLERFKLNIGDKDLSDLPEIPEGRMRISPIWPIASIAIAISTTVLLLGYPGIMGFRFESTWITVFDTQVIRGMWLPVLVWTILEIVAEVAKLVEGRYTLRVAAVTIIIALMQVACLIIVFGNGDIVNPDFVHHIGRVGADMGAPGWILNNIIFQPNIFVMGIVIVALIAEVVEVLVMVYQARR